MRVVNVTPKEMNEDAIRGCLSDSIVYAAHGGYFDSEDDYRDWLTGTNCLFQEENGEFYWVSGDLVWTMGGKSARDDKLVLVVVGDKDMIFFDSHGGGWATVPRKEFPLYEDNVVVAFGPLYLAKKLPIALAGMSLPTEVDEATGWVHLV